MDIGSEKKIAEDKEINDIVNSILLSGGNEIRTLIKELNKMVFNKYCEKSYLFECEPEYCVYRLNKTCFYIKAISYFKEKHKISLVYYTLND
jgi:hypothetical protein